jgi:hypothetical protein
LEVLIFSDGNDNGKQPENIDDRDGQFKILLKFSQMGKPKKFVAE